MSMNDVEADQQRDFEPGFLDCQPFHLGHRAGPHEVEQVPDAPRRGGTPGEGGAGPGMPRRCHGELPQLLGEGHLRHQFLNSIHRNPSAKNIWSRKQGKIASGIPGGAMETSELATLPDEQLLEIVQRQTFNFFWDGAHPVSGLAPDRCTTRANAADDKVAIGGSGFGIMAILVAAERGGVTRDAAIEHLTRMLDLLTAATCYHGAYAHFVNGRTAAT